MNIGKVPNDLLEKLVFNNIKNKRDEVLVKAAIGEDNAIVDFGEEVCVLSTDPITGTTEEIGSLAIYVSCNDIASSGAEPIGVLLTILLPPSATEEDLDTIMKDAGRASKELNVEIIGGHTEVTDAVNRIVISATALGKMKKKNMLDSTRIKVGDKILMTKYAGIEGTSIIAKEKKDYLRDKLGEEKLREAIEMGKLATVLKEGIILGKMGVGYMHDITEGGVLGAVWEASEAINKGVKIYEDLIPMKEVTKEIARILNIDPYRLISSGSMLVIADKDKVDSIKERLRKENIDISVIGEVVEKGRMIYRGDKAEEIPPPGNDELYRALSQ